MGDVQIGPVDILFFAERGISPEWISPFDKLSHHDFWKLHAQVDVALDRFPFTCCTPALARLRQCLRPRMAAAPLTDEVRFMRDMEQA